MKRKKGHGAQRWLGLTVNENPPHYLAARVSCGHEFPFPAFTVAGSKLYPFHDRGPLISVGRHDPAAPAHVTKSDRSD